MAEDKYLAFVRRHSDPYMPTLNPQSVIQRIDDILEQIERMEAIFRSQDSEKPFDFNILNYYIVSAITCLEWHARGRLVDFVSVYPNKIEQSDFSNLKNSALNFAHNTQTIAQLIGAIKHVSSADDYMGVFKRILLGFGSDNDPWSLVKEFVVVDGNNILKAMFEDRHSLVHEIWVNQIGPFVLRDPFDFGAAKDTLTIVKRVVETIELEISKLAPPYFPNVGEYWNEEEVLEKLISELESQIESKLSNEIGDVDTWRKIINNRMASWSVESEAISQFHALRPVRWLDYRGAVKVKIMSQRYEILKYISQKLTDFYDD